MDTSKLQRVSLRYKLLIYVKIYSFLFYGWQLKRLWCVVKTFSPPFLQININIITEGGLVFHHSVAEVITPLVAVKLPH
jgi:hypothetical protein